ncbi:unnamed protein product, partial [Rotaria sordida]
NYLSNLKEGDQISCTVRASNVTFHPPEDTKIPIVMTAARTERAAQLVCRREIGSAILYYGCRLEEDFLYANKFDRWSKLGAVQIKTVFSRQGINGKKYVQDLIWEDRDEIAK